MIDLVEEQWKEIDALILSRRIVPALRSLREWTGISLGEAIDLHHTRYRQLREERPDDFVCSDADYWVGVYS